MGLTPHPQPSPRSTCLPTSHSLASVCSREPSDPTHKVHTVLSQPVKTLEEKKESKERNKAGAEVVPKDGEGQTSLSDSIPGTFQKVLGFGHGMTWNQIFCSPSSLPLTFGSQTSYLHLCCPQLPKENLAHHLAQEKDKDKGLDVQDLGVRRGCCLRSPSALLCLGLIIQEPPHIPIRIYSKLGSW